MTNLIRTSKFTMTTIIVTFLSLIGFVCLYFTPITASGIRLLNTCSCLGQTISFECVVTGGTLTVWSGTAFDCSASEISIRHSNFVGRVGSCNNGAIIGRGVTSEGNQYTSRLDVTLSNDLVGRTVACYVDDGNVNFIGSMNLAINNTNIFLPPEELDVPYIGPDEITYGWSVVPHDGCPSFQYNINTTNCGMCIPSMTTTNMSTCTNFSINGDMCSFGVQSIICGDINGKISSLLQLHLKVPDAPLVQIIPHYNNDRTLKEVETNISTEDSFRILDNPKIDGSADNYTIIYADADTGATCFSDTVLTSSCEGEICNHLFDVSLSSCRMSNFTLSVFATNILGNGQLSTPTTLGMMNNFVEVMFDPSTRTVNCLFLNRLVIESEGNKICTAIISHGENCDQSVQETTGRGEGNSVTTPPLELTVGVAEFCLIVTAKNGNEIVIVERKLSILIGMTQQNIAAVITASIFMIFTLIICFGICICLCIFYYSYRRKLKYYNYGWYDDDFYDEGESRVRSIVDFDYEELTSRHLKFYVTEDHVMKKRKYEEILSKEVLCKKFVTRAKIIKFLRTFLDDKEFLEVETPVLNSRALKTRNRQYEIYSHLLNKTLPLPLATDCYLKLLVTEGLNHCVYEVGRQLSTQRINRSHSLEYTTCGFCMADLDYKGLINMTEELLSNLVKEVRGDNKIVYQKVELDFTPPFGRISIISTLEEKLNMRFPPASEFTTDSFRTVLENKCKDRGVECKEPRTTIRMLLKLINMFIIRECTRPTFLIDYPQVLSSSAKRRDDNTELSRHFVLIVHGMEICNAYTEITDQKPELQNEQQAEAQAGVEDANMVDDKIQKCIACWKMGIDRLTMFLTDSRSIKDVQLFPIVKPKGKHEIKSDAEHNNTQIVSDVAPRDIVVDVEPHTPPDVPALEQDVPDLEPDIQAVEPDIMVVDVKQYVPAVEADVPVDKTDVLVVESDVPAVETYTVEREVAAVNPDLLTVKLDVDATECESTV